MTASMIDTEAAELEGIVEADAATATLIATYMEAKRVEDDARARTEELRTKLLKSFEAEGAAKFIDATGDVLLARVKVLNPQAYNWDLLKRLAPKAVQRAMLPRTSHYRLNPPRVGRH